MRSKGNETSAPLLHILDMKYFVLDNLFNFLFNIIFCNFKLLTMKCSL